MVAAGSSTGTVQWSLRFRVLRWRYSLQGCPVPRNDNLCVRAMSKTFAPVRVTEMVTIQGGMLRQPVPLPVLRVREDLYASVEMSDWLCKGPRPDGVRTDDTPRARRVQCVRVMLPLLRALGVLRLRAAGPSTPGALPRLLAAHPLRARAGWPGMRARLAPAPCIPRAAARGRATSLRLSAPRIVAARGLVARRSSPGRCALMRP